MLISFTVTAKLICFFVFAYADCWFSYGIAHLSDPAKLKTEESAYKQKKKESKKQHIADVLDNKCKPTYCDALHCSSLSSLEFYCPLINSCYVWVPVIHSFLYPPQNEVLGGYTVFSLSVIPSFRQHFDIFAE